MALDKTVPLGDEYSGKKIMRSFNTYDLLGAQYNVFSGLEYTGTGDDHCVSDLAHLDRIERFS